MSYGESKIGQPWRGYYITAYGIAVKHGYTGTEEEWLESLTGAAGAAVEMQHDETAQELQWRLEGETEWKTLLDIADMQGSVVEETLAAASASQTAAAASETAAAASESAAATSATAAQTAQAAAATSATAAAASETAAEAAATAAQTAQAAAESAQADAETASTSAQGYATTSGSNATAAAASATEARSSKTSAENASTAATSAKNAAAASESAAATSATAAQTARAAAAASETAAAASKTAAETAAVAALASKNAAQEAQNAAETAETAAEGYSSTAATKAAEATQSAADAEEQATASESWAVGGTGTRTGEDTNNAKYWCESAAQAAGGGVTSFNGRGGAVSSQSGDYSADMVGADAEGTAAGAVSAHNSAADAHASLLAGKSNTGHTHDDRYYTQSETDALLDGKADSDHTHTAAQVGADASGTAANAVSAHNSSETAHNSRFAAKADAADLTAHTEDTGNPHGVTAAQTGADAAGTAAGAVSAHNEATDAHASLLAGKSNTGHTHDDRYYTEDETDTLLGGKAASSHTHGAGDITSGTLALARGGTGQTTALAAAKALGRGYGTCATAAATAAKAGSLSGFVLNTGAVVGIKFTYGNTATAPTLNVNSTGAKSIVSCITAEAVQSGDIEAGQTCLLQYNGTQWVLLNPKVEGGGMSPRIVATAPTGSTVICSNGTVTLTATEESGAWAFDLPDYGTWTVTATLSGQTASDSVEVDQVKLYTMSLVYLSDTFSANEWSAIIGVCQSGNVPAAWVVGNQKTMTINGASYTVTIIGKNHDTYTEGGTAPLTFQLQDCYGTTYAMNSSNTNTGGWTSSAMRSTHLPAILALMPAEVQAGIREVNKLTSAGSQSSTINTTADKLFLLSEIEIFGTVSYSKSGEGSQYAYYAAGNSKVKNRNGSANIWWERSPYGSSSTNFCLVNSNGSASNYSASNSNGVAFGFCF